MSFIKNVFDWLKSRPLLAAIGGVIVGLFGAYWIGHIKGYSKRDKKADTEKLQEINNACERELKYQEERQHEYNKIDKKFADLNNIDDPYERDRKQLELSRELNSKVESR